MKKQIYSNMELSGEELSILYKALSELESSKETEMFHGLQEKLWKAKEKNKFCEWILYKFDNHIPFEEEELSVVFGRNFDKIKFDDRLRIGSYLQSHTDCYQNESGENFSKTTIRFDSDNKYGQQSRYLQCEYKVLKHDGSNYSFLDEIEFLSIREVYPESIKYIRLYERGCIDDYVKEFVNLDSYVYNPFTMEEIALENDLEEREL